MLPIREISGLARLSGLQARPSLPEGNQTEFKTSILCTWWYLVRVLASGALMAVGVAMYFNMTSADAPDAASQGSQLDSLTPTNQQQNPADQPLQLPANSSEDLWTKVDPRVVVDQNDALNVPKEEPWLEPSLNPQASQSIQQGLITMGVAKIEKGRFQASVAEADDAGHGKLLLTAGFTEQQIRNAQERQRKAYEEAGAKAWFQILVSIRALAELRSHGFADFHSNINIAAAQNAGLEDLLLQAGVTEQQISGAQHQRP